MKTIQCKGVTNINGLENSGKWYCGIDYTGGNRVCMTSTLFRSTDGLSHLCAITAAGCQALSFNTFGGEAFPDRRKEPL